jgi:ligand-binding sensor domain-containing protein
MVYRIEADRVTAVQPRAGQLYHPQVMVADQAGSMLYTSGPELYRDGQRIFRLPSPEPLQSPVASSITAVTQDHEGSIWLGTYAAGLHRLKPAPFTTYSEAEGLSGRNVYSVYEDRDGAIWVGTLSGGSNRLEQGRVRRLDLRDGFPLTTLSFLQDRAGRMWLGGGNGPGVRVCTTPYRRCEAPGGPLEKRGAMAMHEDASGAIWFGTVDGLVRYDGRRWVDLTDTEGAPRVAVRVFRETRDGALWMGTTNGGLVRYHHGRFTRVTTADGLPFDAIRAIHLDADGWLWVGTEGRGLARLDPRDWRDGRRGGRIVSYRMTDGLFDEVVHQILEDDYGRLWMSSNRGIFWVPRSELLAFADGSVRRINSTGYSERDGLRNREANGGSQPAGIKARDGRLWFPTQDGVAVVDPAQIRHNPVPPNVVIEQL